MNFANCASYAKSAIQEHSLNNLAVASYDLINLLHDTISKDPNLRKLDLVKALQFTGTREGIAGKYQVKKTKNNVPYYSFPISVHQIRNGVDEVVDEISFIE